MALDERYFTPISLEVNFVSNDTGLPLSGGYAEFYKDTNRVIGKPVYQLTGSPPNYTYTALSNPVRMNAVGKFIPVVGATSPIAIYAYPYDDNGDIENYYVVIKDSNDIEQEVREAWPNLSSGDDPTKIENSVANEISNSQFVEVSFNQDSGYVISIVGSVSDQVYQLSTDWDLVVSTSGNATITINRLFIAGSLNIVTNPPYTLDVLTSGANINRLWLRQRLNSNPDIWANGYVAGNFVISSKDGQDHSFKMIYSPSVAPSPTDIIIGTTGTTGYQHYTNTVSIDAGNNTDTSENGYVDIIIEMPTIGHFDITSLQVVGLSTNEQGIAYDQQTVDRQQDHLFHHYSPLLKYKPIDGYLVGWFFPYNPAQWGTSVSMSSGSLRSKYLWDQTIGYQGTTSGFSASRNSDNQFTITTSSITNAAIIQYMDQTTIRSLLSKPASVYAKLMKGIATDDVICTISLWYTKDANLPSVSSNISLVLTLDANGKPDSFHGNWLEIPLLPLGDDTINVNSSDIISQNERYINNFFLNDADETSLATFGAIVVGFSSMASGSVINITDISCVPGGLAAPSSEKGFSQTLQECRRYYETSYYPDTVPSVTLNNHLTRKMTFNIFQEVSHTQYISDISSFEIKLIERKRIIPTVTLYPPTSTTANRVSFTDKKSGAFISGNSLTQTNPVEIGSTFWTANIYLERIVYEPSGNNSRTFRQTTGSHAFYFGAVANIDFHYIADARLGIV